MQRRTKLVLGILGAGLLTLAVVVCALILWSLRPLTTELIDGSGQQLTSGSPHTESEDGSSDRVFADVRMFIEARNFAAAQDALLTIIEESNQDGEACVLLCNVMRELEDPDAAADYGLKAVSLLPDSPEAHLAYAKALGQQMLADMQGLGGMLRAMRRLGPFRHALDRVIELNPDDTEARGMLVFTNLAPKPIGNIDRAIAVAREVESRDPVSGKRLLAMCYQRKEETQRAKEILLEGIEQNPNAPGLRVSLADIYAEEKQFEAADEEYEAARRSGVGEEYYRSLYNQARMRVQNRFEPERAIALLDEFIQGDPKGEGMPRIAHASWRRGNALEQLARDEEALAAYEESLRHDSSFEQAEQSLGELRARIRSERP